MASPTVVTVERPVEPRWVDVKAAIGAVCRAKKLDAKVMIVALAAVHDEGFEWKRAWCGEVSLERIARRVGGRDVRPVREALGRLVSAGVLTRSGKRGQTSEWGIGQAVWARYERTPDLGHREGRHTLFKVLTGLTALGQPWSRIQRGHVLALIDEDVDVRTWTVPTPRSDDREAWHRLTRVRALGLMDGRRLRTELIVVGESSNERPGERRPGRCHLGDYADDSAASIRADARVCEWEGREVDGHAVRRMGRALVARGVVPDERSGIGALKVIGKAACDAAAAAKRAATMGWLGKLVYHAQRNVLMSILGAAGVPVMLELPDPALLPVHARVSPYIDRT